MKRAEVLRQLAEHREELAGLGVKSLAIFGSVARDEAGPESWSVLLHCPNCGVHREGVFSQACVEAFDEMLDQGADALAADYKRLMRSNLMDEIERFAIALEADAVLPEDF